MSGEKRHRIKINIELSARQYDVATHLMEVLGYKHPSDVFRAALMGYYYFASRYLKGAKLYIDAERVVLSELDGARQ